MSRARRRTRAWRARARRRRGRGNPRAARHAARASMAEDDDDDDDADVGRSRRRAERERERERERARDRGTSRSSRLRDMLLGDGGRPSARPRRHYDSSSESGSAHGEGGARGSDDDSVARRQRPRVRAVRGAAAFARTAPVDPTARRRRDERARPRHGRLWSRDRFDKRELARADAQPIAVDGSIGWDAVGGLARHVRALKEVVTLPLLYPELFLRFGASARGVLFSGPPGTGKTGIARARANVRAASTAAARPTARRRASARAPRGAKSPSSCAGRRLPVEMGRRGRAPASAALRASARARAVHHFRATRCAARARARGLLGRLSGER